MALLGGINGFNVGAAVGGFGTGRAAGVTVLLDRDRDVGARGQPIDHAPVGLALGFSVRPIVWPRRASRRRTSCPNRHPARLHGWAAGAIPQHHALGILAFTGLQMPRRPRWRRRTRPRRAGGSGPRPGARDGLRHGVQLLPRPCLRVAHAARAGARRAPTVVNPASPRCSAGGCSRAVGVALGHGRDLAGRAVNWPESLGAGVAGVMPRPSA